MISAVPTQSGDAVPPVLTPIFSMDRPKLTTDPVRLTIFPLRMQFPVHVARTRLSRLIDAALDGEEVVISRGARPVVRLVPLPGKRSPVGVLEGRMTVPDGLFEPMFGEDLRLREGG